MPRVRVGVVLLLRSPIADEVDGLRRACGDRSLGRVPPHLTLVPPVNVRSERLGDALALLRAAAAAVDGPLGLGLGPVATFHPQTPVVYLAVDGDVDLVHGVRGRVLHPPLVRRLPWPFVPHVTLADEMAPERIRATVAALADYRAETTVEGLHLLAEGPGRVWRPIADARFGPTAVVARGGLPVELWVSDGPDPETAPLLGDVEPVPEGARPFTVTARRERTVLGVAAGFTRDGEARISSLVTTGAAGLEDIERHLRRAALDL